QVQDVHIATMNIGAVFSYDGRGFQPSEFGTVPPTGTELKRIDDGILETMLKSYRDEIFYLGRIYGSYTKMPFWFKHFGTGRNGAGEAYHIGIFGKTGSGKSVLAKLMLIAYARHKQMSIIVIDPQGEFSKDFSGYPSPGHFKLNLKEIVGERLKRKIDYLPVKNLLLDRWELFEEILAESEFFEKLTIPKGENRNLACRIVVDELRKKKVKLTDLWKKETLEIAWQILNDENNLRIIYKTEGSRKRFVEAMESADRNELYENIWMRIGMLFNQERNNCVKIEQMLSKIFQQADEGTIISVDLSEESIPPELYWNRKIQLLIIQRLLNGIRVAAENSYKQGKSLNCLVILDEAHRFAPREKPEEEEIKSVRDVLLDAVRTTRKYGLGWMFISQTISSLHREIINQLRIMFFGYGLSMGAELLALKEIIGGDPHTLGLYQSFRDPHSFDVSSRQYSFMSVGPVSPLSFSGTPLFFTAFNNPEEFLKANNIYRLRSLFDD
ncbi:MAG: ATP-binding protein, partial [Archaeoglobaceae archaeon]